MKNLDQSIYSGLNLDESFSNYTGSDVTSLRNQIDLVKIELSEAEKNLQMAKDKKYPPLVKKYYESISVLKSKLSILQSELSKIPKVIIDAVDKIGASTSQLAQEEKNKQQAAELLALENKNKEIQAAIDKAKGVTGILDDKLNGNVKPLPTDIVPTTVTEIEEPSFFTTKNIIIGVSSVLVLLGGFFLVKRLLKKQ